VIRDGLSVRQLEEKLRRMEKEGETHAEKQELPDEYSRVLEHIGKYFSNSISLRRSPSGKGIMTIKFDSDEEMRNFLQALDDAKI